MTADVGLLAVTEHHLIPARVTNARSRLKRPGRVTPPKTPHILVMLRWVWRACEGHRFLWTHLPRLSFVASILAGRSGAHFPFKSWRFMDLVILCGYQGPCLIVRNFNVERTKIRSVSKRYLGGVSVHLQACCVAAAGGCRARRLGQLPRETDGLSGGMFAVCSCGAVLCGHG